MTDAKFVELMFALHSRASCHSGGPMHVVSDDINVDDASLDFVEAAIADDAYYTGVSVGERAVIVQICTSILNQLRAVEEEERERLINLYWQTATERDVTGGTG